PHGPHHLHRLRRRRRHRGHREHLPPHRRRHEPVGRRPPGRARSRLHRPFHQRLPRRRLSPHPADGRYRRPPVPRVRHGALHRHHDLAARLPHHHAHDVLAPLAPPRARRPRQNLPCEREAFHRTAQRLPAQPHEGPATSSHHHYRPVPHHRGQCL